MAIQISIIENNGAAHPEAYIKVGAYQVFPDEKRAVIWLDYYHDRTYAPRTAGNPQGAEGTSIPFRAREAQYITNVPGRVDSEGNVVQEAHNDFDDLFEARALNALDSNPVRSAYRFLKARAAEFSTGQDV